MEYLLHEEGGVLADRKSAAETGELNAIGK